MAILIQHGWGKGARIDKALSDGLADGVVLSPRDETPESMATLVAHTRQTHGRHTLLLFDPQYYAAAIPDARDKNLPDYPYYTTRTRLSQFGARDIPDIVRPVIDYQMSLGVDRVISPTVILDSFDGRWSQVALYLAQESIAYHAEIGAPQPLLVSVVIAQPAFYSNRALNEFLDDLSVLKAAGFYVVVDRVGQARYTQKFTPGHLADLMYLVYVLAELNQYELVCGYTDFAGVLLQAVGARFCASGWSHGLRQFSRDRFLPAAGGQVARPRYASLPMLTTPRLTELDTYRDAGVLQAVLSGGPYDQLIRQAPTPSRAADSGGWTPEVSALHHWWTLSRAHSKVQGPTVQRRIAACLGLLEQAKGTYEALESHKVPLGRESAPRHLADWWEALDGFSKKLVG